MCLIILMVMNLEVTFKNCVNVFHSERQDVKKLCFMED